MEPTDAHVEERHQVEKEEAEKAKAITSPGNSAYAEGEGGQVTTTPSGPASASYDSAHQASHETTGDDVKDEREVGNAGVGTDRQVAPTSDANLPDTEKPVAQIKAEAEAAAAQEEAQEQAEEASEDGADSQEAGNGEPGATEAQPEPSSGPTTGPETEPVTPGGGTVPPEKLLEGDQAAAEGDGGPVTEPQPETGQPEGGPVQ